MQKSSNHEKALQIVQRIQEVGGQALFAGGAVRDMLLGHTSSDIDIATSLTPTEVQELFEQTIAVGIAFGVVVVVIEGSNFEVATFRSDGAYIDGRHPSEVHFSSRNEDAHRRDFSINALYYDPISEQLYDDIGGEADLKKGVIRAVGNAEKRFEEDGLRLMRACRFAARLGFEIEKDTLAAICSCAININKISPERIGEELLKIVTGNSPERGIELLQSTGLLEIILPEIEAMRGVEQPPQFHPEGDVWIHTLKLLSLLKELPQSKELALACLFHDIGKPPTQVFADRIRFNNHESVGAEMTESICRRLKFSNKLRECVVHLVRTHLHFIPVQKMRVATLKKFIWQEHFELMMQLHWADCMASHQDLSCYDFCMVKQKEFGAEQEEFEPLIKGRDLIALGLKPGRGFTPILQKAQELQLEGHFSNRGEALAWLKEEAATR